ncbi:hypothetical protein GQ53DRAFT_526083 [Thozetella sp. PMI_491]|nr:hypothetical protein GQ53DRAFT_526083 [Thozetella sp. PMI_491]
MQYHIRFGQPGRHQSEYSPDLVTLSSCKQAVMSRLIGAKVVVRVLFLCAGRRLLSHTPRQAKLLVALWAAAAAAAMQHSQVAAKYSMYHVCTMALQRPPRYVAALVQPVPSHSPILSSLPGGFRASC